MLSPHEKQMVLRMRKLSISWSQITFILGKDEDYEIFEFMEENHSPVKDYYSDDDLTIELEERGRKNINMILETRKCSESSESSESTPESISILVRSVSRQSSVESLSDQSVRSSSPDVIVLVQKMPKTMPNYVKPKPKQLPKQLKKIIKRISSPSVKSSASPSLSPDLSQPIILSDTPDLDPQLKILDNNIHDIDDESVSISSTDSLSSF
jgi:hypothetical protein